MCYRRRIIDSELDEHFPHLAAIALEGAKGVGKTATGSQRAAVTLSLTTPSQREALGADLDLVTQVATPVFIDEWQLEPAVWDRVRRAVDDDPTGGRFLLAGSAGVARGVRIHSGAGRIVRLQMRPMSLNERNIHESTVSLRSLLAGGTPISGASDMSLPQYVDEILRSGFPGIRVLPERARQLQLDSYLARIVETELPDNGINVRRPAALRAWLTAYAAASASTAAHSVVLDAATPGEGDKPARQTVASYRDELRRLFILDPVDPWIPALAPLKRLTYSPKHHLVDPALAARLIGVTKAALLVGDGDRVPTTSGTLLGALFESLATQSVRVYAQAAGARVGHLRTKSGDHEVDLVIESDDRSAVAIEVKLSATVGDADVRHLNWLQEQIGERLRDRVVLTSGDRAYRRRDGVAVIPLALLGP